MRFFSSPKFPLLPRGPSSLIFCGYRGSSLRAMQPGRLVEPLPPSAARWITYGAIQLFPLCVFMVSTGGGQRKVNYSELIGSKYLLNLSSVNFIPSDIFIRSLSFPSTWTLYRLVCMTGWNHSGIFTADETFCFKWKQVHGQFFQCSVFPNATCFIFCAVWWPHSGWQW